MTVRTISLTSKKSLLFCGLMSGTSADGVTSVLAKITGSGANVTFKVLDCDTYPFPSWLRRRIFELCDPATGTVDKICRMNFVLGEVFAASVLRITEKAGVELQQLDYIASHGQTIYHSPNPIRQGEWEVGSTLQIAESSVIAERTGVPVISDFRARDVAAGGQGAPLVSYADFVIFRNSRKGRAILNIGGISNVTVIPAGASKEEVLAFDTGPGNMILDHAVYRLTKGRMKFDRYGELSSKGRVNRTLLRELLGHPFFRREPPKSTGREEFGAEYAEMVLGRAGDMNLDMYDTLATLTELTVESIREALERFVLRKATIDELIAGGGGTYNRRIMSGLKAQLKVKLQTHEEFGIHNHCKEALAFCILANQTVRGYAGNLPSATGARRDVVLGKITPGV